jgi:phosphopantetheinyl transferase
VIGLSARKSSASEIMLAPGVGELHLWFCHRDMFCESEPFQREVLSRYADVAPEDLKFTRGSHGKPALSFPHLPIVFNHSDSRDRMVLAVSTGNAIGVDLEYCDRKRDIEKLARRYFSDSEVGRLLACEEPERVARFYDYWTLKEATIKAAGGSLGQELENTRFDLTDSVHYEDELTPGCITPLSSTLKGQAWFALLQPFDDYRLALCCLASQEFTTGVLGYYWPRRLPEAQPLTLLAVSSSDEKPAGIASL